MRPMQPMQADLALTPGQVVRALTLTQPWATLLAHGVKRIETRDWGTSYRGLLAIHAARHMPGWAVGLCHEEPFNRLLWELGYRRISDLPGGAVVGYGILHRCYRITSDNLPAAGEGDELALGDYTPGRFAWEFEDLRPLATPIPARGAPGLWTWTVPEGVKLEVGVEVTAE